MTSRPNPREGYDPASFGALVSVEDRHFWFRHRNRILAAVVRQIVASHEPGYRVLELGCGDGNVLRHLQTVCSDGLVVGMDLFGEGLRFARHRTSVPLVCGDAHRPPFRCRFDLIGAFDVLEHLADDRHVLESLAELLSPNGSLLLTVPAHMELWSYADNCGHYRRYTRPQLRDLLASCGFQVDYLTEFMCPLYPVLWLGRRIVRWVWRTERLINADAPPPDLKVLPVANAVLEALLAPEVPLIERRFLIPFGSSLLAVAGKRR